MKKLMMIAALLMSAQSFGQTALGEIVGEVVEEGTVVAVFGAVVYIEESGKKYQARTDVDGRFRISAVPSGAHIMNVRYLGDTLKDIIVDVPMDGIYNAGQLDFAGVTQSFQAVNVTANGKMKLIDGFLPVPKLTSEQIDKSPAKFNVKALVASMTSDVRQTEDGQLVFRGARKGDMIYMIDGVKTRDAGSMPGVSIGRMMVYTGGLPAKYGDTLGGVVVIESKSYFDLYRAWEADQIRMGLR